MTAYLLRMRSGKEGGGKGPLVQEEKSGTLATGNDQTLFVIAMAGNTIGRKPMNGGNGNGFETDGKMYTLTATDVHGVCYESHGQDARYDEKTLCPTITQKFGTGGGNVPLTIYDSDRRHANYKELNQAPTLVAKMGTGGGNVPLALALNDQGGSQMDVSEGRVATLRAQEHGHQPIVGFERSQVRRLTPTECERLMGFPDGYTNIKENCPDAPRYKALGNSWAVPVVRWLGKRIEKELQ